MRSEEEMFQLILEVAQQDERVRLVGLNGSRANPNAPGDHFQDFDIVYVVNNLETFKLNDDWLNVFGERVIMQKPDDMELFAPNTRGWFAYLMQFEDGNRIDLSLVPMNNLEAYLQSDPMVRILLDKDSLAGIISEPSDEAFWIKRPTPGMYNDCCNEFWWVSTYVAKGLARKELPYATSHIETVRTQLMTMLSWEIGFKEGFNFSIGKNFKYLQKYLSVAEWKQMLITWRMDGFSECWQALLEAQDLFRKTSREVARHGGFTYPEYDLKVTAFIKRFYKENLEIKT